MKGFASDTTKSAKNLAQQVAKQIAGEPFEILKKAPGQITGIETGKKPDQNLSVQESSPQSPQPNTNSHEADKAMSMRRVEALDREIDDIRRNNLFKELQRRIAEGQEVHIQEESELSLEQKQVLNAQIEAVKTRNLQSMSQGSFQEPTSKKGRKLFNFGQKQAAERQQTRVEKPVPPSG